MDFKTLKEKAISSLSPTSLLQLVRNLYGIVEEKNQKIIELEDRLHKLQNIIRKNHGEQELPDFNKSTTEQKTENDDGDSDDNDDSLGPPNVPKNKPGNRGKRGEKLSKIKVDRKIELKKLGKDEMPADCIYKGTRKKTIQDIVLKTDNVELIIHRWYSPSKKKYYESSIPLEYASEFGATLRAFVVILATQMRTTEPLIKKLLSSFSIIISTGQISNILQKKPDALQAEYQDACRVAINKKGSVQIDWTGTPIKGIAGYTTAVVNNFFSFFRTSFSKERFQAMQSLNFGSEIYTITNESVEWFQKRAGENVRGLSEVKNLIGRKIFDSEELYLLAKNLAKQFTWNKIIFNHFLASTLISEMRTDFFKNLVLISDDAKEYRGILDYHQGCWVHEFRHYKNLFMMTNYGQEIMDLFWEQAWGLWDLMESYKDHASPELKLKIQNKFDEIFLKKWDFFSIDRLRENTIERKKYLFEFLEHPDLKINIHNNLCENGIRAKVVKRKISSGHRSLAGAKSANFWLGLLQTLEKNQLSFFDFLVDRFRGKNLIQSLPMVIANSSI